MNSFAIFSLLINLGLGMAPSEWSTSTTSLMHKHELFESSIKGLASAEEAVLAAVDIKKDLLNHIELDEQFLQALIQSVNVEDMENCHNLVKTARSHFADLPQLAARVSDLEEPNSLSESIDFIQQIIRIDQQRFISAIDLYVLLKKCPVAEFVNLGRLRLDCCTRFVHRQQAVQALSCKGHSDCRSFVLLDPISAYSDDDDEDEELAANWSDWHPQIVYRDGDDLVYHPDFDYTKAMRVVNRDLENPYQI